MPPGGYRILFDADYREIKRLIWEGMSQVAVAHKYDVSQPHINRIANGHVAYHIAWPDGSVKGLSSEKKAELRRHRKLRELASFKSESDAQLDIEGEDRGFIERVAAAARQVEAKEREEEYQRKRPKYEDLFAKDYDPDSKPIVHKTKYNPVPWDEVLAQEGDNPFVKAAEESGDLAAKVGLGQMLRGLPAESWTKQLVEDATRRANKWLSEQEAGSDE